MLVLRPEREAKCEDCNVHGADISCNVGQCTQPPALTVMGIACVDTLVDVVHFPAEDVETRATASHKYVQHALCACVE